MININFIKVLVLIQFIVIIILLVLLLKKPTSKNIESNTAKFNPKWYSLNQNWLGEYKLKTNHDHQKKMKDKIFQMGMKLPKNAVFVDTGAHIGDTGLFLKTKWKESGRNDIKVISIEPDDSKAKFIKDMAKIENVNIDVINAGLWNKKTKGNVIKDENYSAMWRVKENPNGSVTFRTLDDILDGSRIDILQLDVEGSEPQALEGAEKSIRKYKPAIFIEIEFNEAKSKTSNQAISILKSFGYKQSGKRMDNDLLFIYNPK